ncbi:hypothetical protein PQR02_28375 [Paraburkholderia sediminicola]|uniref:Uncharacterized protein n=1 Tax=Paraburkholderia rhynchosiae TaxID=487049 RepID=A0ACC7NGF9_9BURK
MITSARIEQVLRPAGMGWITALRSPQIAELIKDRGPWQPTLALARTEESHARRTVREALGWGTPSGPALLRDRLNQPLRFADRLLPCDVAGVLVLQ